MRQPDRLSPPAVEPTTRLSGRKRMVLTAVTAAGVVVALEIILHSLSWGLRPVAAFLSPSEAESVTGMVPDDRLGHRPAAGFFEHDSRGFRNPRALEHADLVALGDSQTYGTSVAAEDAWPRQLGAITGVSAYNMAFGGYGPTHSLALLDEALALEPAVVVEAFYAGNDLWDCFNMVVARRQLPELMSDDVELARRIREVERSDPIVPRLELLSGAYRRGDFGAASPQVSREGPPPGQLPGYRRFPADYSGIYAVARGLRRELTRAGARFGADDWSWLKAKAESSNGLWEVLEFSGFRTIAVPQYRDVALNLTDPRIFEGHRLALEAIRRMHARVLARGADFLVVLIPTKEAVFEGLVPEAQRTPDLSALIQHERQVWERTKTALREAGIEFVDVLPSLKRRLERGEQPYFINQDGHPNSVGQRAIAGSVAEWMANRPR